MAKSVYSRFNVFRSLFPMLCLVVAGLSAAQKPSGLLDSSSAASTPKFRSLSRPSYLLSAPAKRVIAGAGKKSSPQSASVAKDQGCAISASGVSEAHNEKEWGPDEKSIVQADKDFCVDAQKKGAAAWERILADNAAVPIGSKVLNAKETADFYGGRYANGLVLRWKATYAKVLGDIGVTSGPYEGTIKQDNESKQAGDKGADMQPISGVYLTVWRRQPDGSWKLQWDSGTPKKK